MKPLILDAHIPERLLKKILASKNIKRWIYLGQDQILEMKIGSCLPQAEQIIFAKELFNKCERSRAQFVDWIDDVSRSMGQKDEWYFSVPAVKNTYTSHLFLNICYFSILNDLLDQNEDIDLVITESPALGQLINQNLEYASYPSINYLINVVKHLQRAAKSTLRYVKHVGTMCLNKISVNSTMKNRLPAYFSKIKNVVFIRNYIKESADGFDQNFLENHYFPQLDKFIKEQGMTPIFMPIPYMVKERTKFYHAIKQSANPIVFIEEFLKWNDYVYMAGSIFRSIFIRWDVPAFHQKQFDVLIKEEYYANITEGGLLTAILYSRFGRRLKEMNIDIKGFINWSESQAFERGLIRGIKLAFPDINIVGSQPFLEPANLISLFPTEQESEYKVLADRYLVLGPYAKKLVTKYHKHLPIDFSPAFRYRAIFDKKNDNDSNNNMLVLFGIGLPNAIHTMRLLLDAKKELESFDKVYLKFHPAFAFDKQKLGSYFDEPFPSNFVFVKGKVEDYLDEIRMGICGGTGTSVELVTRGIPTIVIAESSAITMYYLNAIESGLWKLCFDATEVKEAIEHYRQKLLNDSKEQIFQEANNYRREFFAEPDESYFDHYLNDHQKDLNYA